MQIISNVQMKQMLEASRPFNGMDGTYINARWRNGVYRVAGLAIRDGHRETEFFGNLMDAVQWAKEREAEGHGDRYPEI